jgi:hypothetical protein
MIKVKFSSQGPEIPYLRITKGSRGIVDNCQFFVNDNTKEVDWWVVIESLPKTEQAVCPKENTLFIAMENDLMKNYEQKFLNQFAHVVTCHRTMKHPHKIFTQQAHFSHIGWRTGQVLWPGGSVPDPKNYKKFFTTYDQLRDITSIPKDKLISVVASYKVNTDGQILRNKFIKEMKKHFGDKMDAFSNAPNVFGSDTKMVEDKWDGLAPYKYYLAIENSSVPHYWTSDLGDAYLAGAYPIYYGHPNVSEYFSPDAYTMIDIADIPGSIAIIEKVIAENYFEKRQKEIWEARKLVLDKYNMFQMIADVINSLPQGKNPELITLRPETHLKARIIAVVNKIPVIKTVFNKLYRYYKTFKNK